MEKPFEKLFSLKCVLNNIDIKLCARATSGVKQLIALVTSDSELVFVYNFGELPIIFKRVIWFDDKDKSIEALCFDPSASWLLAVASNGNLYIIPALSLVDPKQKVDCKWCLTDLTQFSKPLECPDSRPTAIVWWQTLDCNQNGIVGYENGDIALISLTDGRCLATCSISEGVSGLFLCQDNSLEAVSLLINGEGGQQWRHMLEQHSTGYIWPLELNSNTDNSTRSRLYALKQKSVDKFTSLKQRFVDTRSNKSDTSSETSESSPSESVQSGPELLPHLCDTYFAPQYARDRYLFSAFYRPASLLTIHAFDIESAPLYTHKLPLNTDQILLTDRLIFAINDERTKISIVSTHFSECRLEGDMEFNEESLLAEFSVKDEKILQIFKLSDLTIPCYINQKKEEIFEFPKTVQELQVRKPRVDTCVVVTSNAVYQIVVETSLVEHFVTFVNEEDNIEKAETLSKIFGLNFQQLLECCGDLKISDGCYHSGIVLYKQAKVHLLKRVLKLAIAGDCKTLLKFILLCLSSNKVDMTMATKIHIENLAVMAYTELILRYYGPEREPNTIDFMKFLRYEDFYDQLLAVNVSCQAEQWDTVTFLAKCRSLQPEVVIVLAQMIQNSKESEPRDIDFLYTLSEPSLTQSLLLIPKSSAVIFKYIRLNVGTFPSDILQRLAVQLDPSQPCAIALVGKAFNCNRFSSSLDSIADDSYDSDRNDIEVNVAKDLVETFVMVLVHLVHKKSDCRYNSDYLHNIRLLKTSIETNCINNLPELRSLSCGFEHAAVVRNNHVYVMGINHSGCLGLGPLLTHSTPPKLVQTLADLRVKVLSVSCGRRHTLALTEYGIYAWGSNNYGQLGLGSFTQESSYPQLVSSIFGVKIIDVVAGQYHTIALTSNGQVYTWGWGIHGQLGHDSCNNEYYPRLLKFKYPIKQVAGGQAHSLILTTDGKLFGFGSNVFGQLESSLGEGNRFLTPQRVFVMHDIMVPIEKVVSSYFYNAVVFENQEVYVWGASPQEVRLFQNKNVQKLSHSSDLPESWKASVLAYTADREKPVEDLAIGYRHLALIHVGKLLMGKTKEDELSCPKIQEPENFCGFYQRFVKLSCGMDYTMGMDHTGKLLAWGSSTMAQAILGRSSEETKNSETKVVIFKNTKRVIKFPTFAQQNNLEALPIEVPGVPTMAITFNPTDHRLILSKNYITNAILSIENDNNFCVSEYNNSFERNELPQKYIREVPKFNYGPKTLHYVLETYHGFYNSENIQQLCINNGNYQAASKIALLDGHISDSLNFQLNAFEKFMNTLQLDLESSDDLLTHNNNINSKSLAHSNSLEQYNSEFSLNILSTSCSLDSIKLANDFNKDNEKETPQKNRDLNDVRENMSQYMQSLQRDENSPPISTVSRLIFECNKNKQNSQPKINIKNNDVKQVIDALSQIIEFYIQKIYTSDNHILMQNVLMKCIEFWLKNSLPISVLESILLKNMDKYFYPLSILLFCKNFNLDVDSEFSKSMSRDGVDSTCFLKEFSTKFCLQLCAMVLENVNKA